jgi:hypothetical protein
MRIETAELYHGDHAEFSLWLLLDLHLLLHIFAPCIIGCVRAVDLDETFF